MAVKFPEIMLPYESIDWRLLAAQKRQLVNIRSKLPVNARNHDLLGGVIHLMDALEDAREEALREIVLLQNHADDVQYFVNNVCDCRSNLEGDLFLEGSGATAILMRSYLILIPYAKLSTDQKILLHRYGLNHKFELE
jgi:hypothetical protein